ncbi:MAG: ABC transporter substrate-binding protein [Gammaproteobacteria bacterium]|nr:ABC transporter substrate-binding protein [Gammaproteobacteria bacterium]
MTSPTGAKIAEFFQGLIEQRLGINVKVDQQTFKQYLQKVRAGDFDLALSSWYPDYGDIATYADLLASWNPNNRGGYDSEAYDQHLQTVLRSTDRQARMDAAFELHKLIKRDVPVLPMAETGSAYVVHPQLRGVVRRVIGADPDYTGAQIISK